MSDDLREECKYGKNCYQRNPAHHARFKHPPKEDENPLPPPKKLKTAAEVESIEEKNTKKVTSVKIDRVFPTDFYAFYDWCRTIKPDDPVRALRDTAGLLLSGNFYELNDEMKWRFYYDPPEFLSLIIQVDSSEVPGDDQDHLGYFWDDPKEKPVFVGCLKNNSCKIKKLGVNLFAAVSTWLKDSIRSADPFRKAKLTKLSESLSSFASDKGFDLELKPDSLKARDRKVVAHPFHGAGLVVPYDKKTCLGYRELPETSSALKKMFKKAASASLDGDESAMDAIQEGLVTFVQFANDEGDPGMGLELGLDLFSFEGGVDAFHPTIKHLLCVAYGLLKRDQLSSVAEAHLRLRKKGQLFIAQGEE